MERTKGNEKRDREEIPCAIVGAGYGWIPASTVVARTVFGLVALYCC